MTMAEKSIVLDLGPVKSPVLLQHSSSHAFCVNEDVRSSDVVGVLAALFKWKKSPLLPSNFPFASCGRNFFQKAHFRTPWPSRTFDGAVLNVRVSRFSGVCSGQYVSVQVWSADNEGFLKIYLLLFLEWKFSFCLWKPYCCFDIFGSFYPIKEISNKILEALKYELCSSFVLFWSSDKEKHQQLNHSHVHISFAVFSFVL